MTVACYLDPSKPKADRWMQAFAAGCGGIVVKDGQYVKASQHVVVGNWPVATNLIPRFLAHGERFFYIDSGYIQTRGLKDLRVEPGRFWPEFKMHHSPARAQARGIKCEPWRREGRHVLICQHAVKFGRPWGIDIVAWNAAIGKKVRKATDRPIVMRPKLQMLMKRRPLAVDLRDAWCVVTHSSTAAVLAALAGVPVFCEPTCAAAAVGCTDFGAIENPVYPDREQWIADLVWHQWSQAEARSGEAWAHLRGET